MKKKSIFERGQRGRRGFSLPSTGIDQKDIGELGGKFLRAGLLDLPDMNEFEVVGHFMELSRKNVYAEDLAAGDSSYCYSSPICEEAGALEGFSGIHPFQPADSVQGAVELLFNLQHMLCDMFGMEEFTLQPYSAESAAHAACRIARAYYEASGEAKKGKMLVAEGAREYMSKAASMVGFDVIPVKTQQDGTLDMEALKSAGAGFAGLMVSCPNRYGKFEKNLRQASEWVHENGGIVIADMSNANGIIGFTNAQKLGVDLVFTSMRETFYAQVGGDNGDCFGLGASSALVPYMPVPYIDIDEEEQFYFNWNREQSIGKAGCYYGGFHCAVKSLVYILSMGFEGLKAAGEQQVLLSNYMRVLLRDKYPEIYAGMCFNTCVLKAGDYEDAPHGEEDTTYLLPAADEVGDFCFCPAYYEDQAALEEYSAALHHDGKKNAAEK